MSTIVANEDLVRRFVAAYGDGRLDDALELVTEDYFAQDVADQDGRVVRGREVFGDLLRSLRAALPDVRETIVDLVTCGERVAFRIRASGHHTGTEWLGRQAAGATVEWECFGIWFIRGGRLAGEVYLDDGLAIRRALSSEPSVEGSLPSNRGRDRRAVV